MNRGVGSGFQDAALARRIREHFDHWRLLPSGDGVVVPWGRSAHPAYHQHSALFAVAVDHYGFAPAGEARRITNLWLRHVRDHTVDPEGHFVRRVERAGAPFESQDDYSRASLNTGSALDHAGMVLAAGPAFWEAEEAPLAAERGDFVAAWPETGYGLVGNARDGRVIVVPTRTWSDRVSSGCDAKYGYRVLHTDFAQSTGKTAFAGTRVPLLYGQPWVELAGEGPPATVLAPAFSFVAPGARALLAGLAGEAVVPAVAGPQLEQRPTGAGLALFSVAFGRDVVHVVRAAAGARPLAALWEYTLPLPCEPGEALERAHGDGWATLGRGPLRQFARVVGATGEGHLEAGARFGAAEEQWNRRAADARAILWRLPADGAPGATYVLHTHYASGEPHETTDELTGRVALERLDGEVVALRLAGERVVVAPRGAARLTCDDYAASAPTSSLFAFSCLEGGTAFGGGDCASVARAGEELVRLPRPGPLALRQEDDHVLVRLAGGAELRPGVLPSGAARVLAETPSGGWEDVTDCARFGEGGLTLPHTLVRAWRRGLAAFRVER
jgi:hypothetical protein